MSETQEPKDVRKIFTQKIDMCPELKKATKEEQRQQIIPTLQEAIDRKKGQLTLF
jgi:hypothetical protein